MLMSEPPSIDGNELTDKGYINQRAALQRRAALVQALYAEVPGDGVIRRSLRVIRPRPTSAAAARR